MKIKFTYQGQEILTDFEVARTHIEAIAEFLETYPDEIRSISLTEYKLIIVSSEERYSYENVSGVWGSKIIFEI